MRSSPATDYLSTIDCRLDCRHEIRLFLKARAVFQDDADGKVLLLTNISSGGFRVGKGKIGPAQRLLVTFPVLGERLVQVCWVHGPRAGCRFSEPLTRGELRIIVEAGALPNNGPIRDAK